MTDQQILIVDAAHIDPARAQFPGLMVLANKAVGEDFTDLDLSKMAGRDVILWCHYAAMLAESIAGAKAARVRVVNGDKSPMSFASRPRESRQYIMANLRAYTPAAELPTSHPMAKPPDEPVGVPVQAEPVRPVASVTPITEARTRQQAKALTDPDVLPAKYSHDSIAAAFTAANPDLRFVKAWGQWLRWNGTYWENDKIGHVDHLARAVCREQAEQAKIGDASYSTVKSIVHSHTISAVEKLARSDPAHARSSEQWDCDPWALNTPGGIVDLRDGTIRPGRPEDHATRITRAAPGGRCDAWYEFLTAATNGDADLMGFMARMAGYCLTGSIRDHALFFIHGNGGNGKGTFLNTLSWILGDYAAVASMEVFTEQHNPQHPTEVAGLMGRRMVSAQEVDEGKRWAEARINSLTGGDPITARFMRQDNFTFMPQFKLVIVGNHKPMFRNVGDAIRRRLHLIPFTHKIDKPDTQLADKLRAEASGILQWAIDGCLDWQSNGLQAPECVRAATDDYLVSQDMLATWIDECCAVTAAEARCSTGALYKCYQGWAGGNGEAVLGRKRFVEAINTRGYATIKSGGTYWIQGLGVRVSESSKDAHNARFPDND